MTDAIEAGALRAQANAALRRGDLDTRVALLVALAETPDATDGDLSDCVYTMLSARRFLEAEAAIRRWLIGRPGNLDLQVRLGMALSRMDRRASCAEALREAAQNSAAPPFAVFYLALNLLNLDLLAEARSTFDRLAIEGGYWASERQRCEDRFAEAERLAAGSHGLQRLWALAALDRRSEFAAQLDALNATQALSPEAISARAIFALRDGGAASAAALYGAACAGADTPVLRAIWARHLIDAGQFEEAEAALETLPEESRPFDVWMTLARLRLLTSRLGPPDGFASSFLRRFPSRNEASITLILSELESRRVRQFMEPAERPPARAQQHIGVPTIIQFWDSEPPLDVRALIDGWRDKNPDLRHELFDAPRARSFLQLNFGDEMAELFDHCHHAAMKSDFFRYAYLFLHGGIYIDADEFCHRSVAPILDALERTECVLHLREGLLPYLANGLIAARPRARVIAAALRSVTDSLRSAVAERRQTDIWHTTGPGALTRAAGNVLNDIADPQALTPFELIAERHLGTFLQTHDGLAYKKTAVGNWRVAATGKAPGALDVRDLAAVFAKKYESGSDSGGHSGLGSSPAHMGAYIHFVEQFIHLNRVASVTDIGCGDWQFSRFVNFGAAGYVGYDVVPSLIARNRLLFGREGVRFEAMPADPDNIPGGDLLLIKDVLQHLPTNTVQEMLRLLLPKFRFALITNSHSKLDAPPINVDAPAGGFRPLDLTAPPFGLNGTYVLEFPSALWERLRTLLVSRPTG